MTNTDEVPCAQLIQVRIGQWSDMAHFAEMRRDHFRLVRELVSLVAFMAMYVIMELLNRHSGVEDWTWAAASVAVSLLVGALVFVILPSIGSMSARDLARSEHWRCEEAARAIIAAHAPGYLPDDLGKLHCWEVDESDLGVATCQARGIIYTMRVANGSTTRLTFSVDKRFTTVFLGESDDLRQLFDSVSDYMGKKADEIVVETIS